MKLAGGKCSCKVVASRTCLGAFGDKYEDVGSGSWAAEERKEMMLVYSLQLENTLPLYV